MMSKSIIQLNHDRCYLCGKPANGDPLDEHHVFFGSNRKKSEKYGLTVYLHHNECHIFGKNAVHNNAEICRRLQGDVQKIAMSSYGWTIEDFIRIFGKNYIDIIEENNCCVVCGEIIPEGRQVCPTCERPPGEKPEFLQKEFNLPIRKCPCRNCEDRAIGCHGRCERYGRWFKYHRAIQAARAKDREMGAYIRDRMARCVKIRQRWSRKP